MEIGDKVQYQSVMVWSNSGMMGGITSQHVTEVVQPVLTNWAAKGWLLHSQSICFATIVGVHLIFYKNE